jgi:HTH-type transcriptional regulator / antitoxin HigA
MCTFSGEQSSVNLLITIVDIQVSPFLAQSFIMPTKIQGKSPGKAPDRYLALIKQLPLRPIRSEKELDRAIAMIDALSDRDELAPEEHDYLIVLAFLIKQYEDEHYPMPPVTGAEMLRYLIEIRQVNQADVAAETGMAESTLSEILNGKRGLSDKYMPTLARYFHVNPGVFVSG